MLNVSKNNTILIAGVGFIQLYFLHFLHTKKANTLHYLIVCADVLASPFPHYINIYCGTKSEH